MEVYEEKIYNELKVWEKSMDEPPSTLGSIAKSIQIRINNLIPERIHEVMTNAIRQMTKTVIFGAHLTTVKTAHQESL